MSEKQIESDTHSHSHTEKEKERKIGRERQPTNLTDNMMFFYVIYIGCLFVLRPCMCMGVYASMSMSLCVFVLFSCSERGAIISIT